MKRHVNIPIFIPHLGCPNMCVFCNQKKISGHTGLDISSVRGDIEAALSTVSPEQSAQIAYFGGSFTGIPRGEMTELLSIAKEFIDDGRVDSIRLSTRPDYIDDEILDILEKYGVRTIELGLQSMRDEVLEMSRRGHTAAAAEAACRAIKARGFELIGQMMTGLPGSSLEDETYTAKKICEMGCDGARIYPTVVFYETELCEMAKRGEYALPTTEELIERSAAALYEFAVRGIPVIRIGLQSGEALLSGDDTYSHTYLPAMGEVCYSRLYRMLIEKKLPIGKCDITVSVNDRCISKAIGQRGENREYIMKKYGLSSLKIKGDGSLSEYEIKIDA